MSLRILGAVMLGCSCALTGFLHEYRQRRRLQSIKQWRDALELLRKATPLKGGAFPGATVGEAKKSVTDWVDSIVTIRK